MEKVETGFKVLELCRLMQQQQILKEKADRLQSWFIKQAEEDIADTKTKNVAYYGPNGEKVSVCTTGTVRLVSETMVREVFGRLAPDFLKEETVYKLTAAGKEILRNLYERNYNQDISVSEVIAEMTADGATRKALIKTLKGNFAKDKKEILKLTELSDQEASDLAFIFTEALNGENLMEVAKAAGWERLDDMRAKAKTAITVDESIKVTVDVK